MLRQKINIIFLISLFLIILSKSALPQQVGVNSVTVRFVQPPTTWSVEKAALKYNKDFSFCMHLDDGNKDIYSHAFQFLNGGIIDGTTYPGKFYTDGCGNDIKFKMSTAVFSLEQSGAVDGHDPNGPYANLNVTWPELIEIYQAGWAVYNHGLTASSSLDPYYSIRRNHSYMKLKMLSATEGGPEFKIHVNPNGNINFTPVAFQEDYIMALVQGYTFGNPSVDVTAYAFGNPLKMGRYNLDGSFIFSTLVDNAAALSVNGAHHWGISFAHFITGSPFPVFRAQMNYVEATYGKNGLDNFWMTTDEEILEYLFIRDAVTVNSQLIYTDLIITFSGNIQTDLRHYALSLVVSGDVPIDTIFIDGGTGHSFNGIGNDTMLINLNWDGHVLIPDTVNAETYVGIAEQSSQQYDWNIAMDYVEMILPGDAKETFRDRLCAIQGPVSPEGYCYCITNAGNDTTICEGDCITLTVDEGVSYLWSTGDTTQSIFVCPVDTTTYYVTVYNEIGCPATDSVTVTIFPNANANAGNDTSICTGNCVDLTASGGISYLWSTNDTTQSIEVCPENTTEYSVIVTNQYGCQANDTVTVFTNPLPIAYAGNDTTICNSDCITLTASGNGNYLWNTGDTTQNIVVCPVDTTTYWVTVTNEFSCSDTDSVSVNISPLPIPEAGNDTTICNGDSTILTAFGGISYLWSTGDTTQSLFVCPVDTTTYYVTVYNEIGCPATDSVTVNIAPDPNANAGNDTTICVNDCITLTASGGTSYLWSTDDTTQSIEVCPENTTEYSVIVTNQYGCQANDTVVVYTNPSPVANAGNDTTICIGDCATLIASGNGNYLWNTGDTTQNIIVCPEDTTIYWLTVTNEFFCSETDSVSVNVNPLPIPEAGNDTTICNCDSTILTASGGVSYLWSTGDTSQSITVNPGDTTQYFVTVTNENNCSAQDSVTVNVLPSPDAFAGNDTIICFGDCVDLSASGGISYLWNTGDTTANINVCPPDTTDYYVTVTNDLGCTNTDTVTVNVNPIPNADAGADTTICEGECITLYASGGESYLWDHGDSTSWTVVCPDTITMYYVSVFDDIGCLARDSVTVSILPGPDIVLTPDTGICVGNDIILTVSGGVSYLWENQSTSASILVSPDSTQYYSVLVTNEFGCTKTDSVRVEIYPFSDPLLGSDTSVCSSYAFDLIAQNGVEFLWNTGDTTSQITVFPEDTTTYYVNMINEFGCLSSDTITLSTIPLTEINFENLLPAYCENEGDVVLSGNPEGGIFMGQGVIGDTFNTESAGAGEHILVYSYLDTITGCTSFLSEYLFIYPMPSVDIGNDTTICIDTYYSLNAGGGYDSYLWTNGSTDSSTTIYPEDYGEGILNFIVFVTKDACVDIDTIKLNIIYCDPGIEKISNQPSIYLFPNPANNSFSVFIDGNENTMDMQILNSRGQEVYSENLINCSSPDYSKRINSSMLPKGLYFVKFYNGNFILVKKLIVD